MGNPYQPLGKAPVVVSGALVKYRYYSLLLTGFAVVVGYFHLLPFLTSPPAMWGWQNWCFGFAPAAYLAFSAVVALVTEWKLGRTAMLMLPLALCPLLLVTALIGFLFYIDSSNIFTFWYGVLGALCLVIWSYFFLSLVRMTTLLRNGPL